ncbi:MAG TPA: galactokinase family protein, partial [Candidatus Binatia bacterium]|nr:galactokinase family protein [Candidatus Binatia bacterium]
MAEHSAELFGRCFGHAPRWVVAAPGRVNLIGEHTDYNDGFVLPMAIERYMVIAGDSNTKREVTLHSVTTGETARFSVRGQIERGEPAWSNYVRGVVA